MLFCNINLISNAVQLLLFFVVFSETPSQLQRRNVSFIIPNTEDGKKRVLVQSQLLDGMLSWVVTLLHFYYIFHYQTTLSTSMLKVISCQTLVYLSSLKSHLLYMLPAPTGFVYVLSKTPKRYSGTRMGPVEPHVKLNSISVQYI